MPEYKVRNTKIGPGRYEFSFGRGEYKLTAGVWNNDVAGGWQIDYGSPGAVPVNDDAPYRRLRDLKAAWGEWAKEAYDYGEAEQSSGSETGPGRTPPVPPPFKRKGPPKHKPSLKEAGPPKRKKNPPSINHVTDPFDPRFRYPSDHENPALRRQHTPLAVVIETWNVLDNVPLNHCPALTALYRELSRTIARECPELKQENGYVQSPATAAADRQEARRLDRNALNTALRGRGDFIDSDDIPF